MPFWYISSNSNSDWLSETIEKKFSIHLIIGFDLLTNDWNNTEIPVASFLVFKFDLRNSFSLSLGRHRQGHWSIPGVSPVLLVIRQTRHGSKKASGCHPQGPRRLPPTTSQRRRSCGVWIPGVLETILKKSKNYYLGFRIYKINDILLSVYIKLMMSN